MTLHLDREQILAILPHRGPMLLWDRVEVEEDGRARAVLDACPAPQWADLTCRPLVVLEAAAQLAGLALAGRGPSPEGRRMGLLAEISRVVFGAAPATGEAISISVEPETSFGNLHGFRVSAVGPRGEVLRGLLTISLR